MMMLFADMLFIALCDMRIRDARDSESHKCMDLALVDGSSFIYLFLLFRAVAAFFPRPPTPVL